jgi:hypothetical protein
MESHKFDEQGLTRAQKYVRTQSSSLSVDLMEVVGSGESDKDKGAPEKEPTPQDECYETVYNMIMEKLSGPEFTQAMDAVSKIQKADNAGPDAVAAKKTLRGIGVAIAEQLDNRLKQADASGD